MTNRFSTASLWHPSEQALYKQCWQVVQFAGLSLVASLPSLLQHDPSLLKDKAPGRVRPFPGVGLGCTALRFNVLHSANVVSFVCEPQGSSSEHADESITATRKAKYLVRHYYRLSVARTSPCCLGQGLPLVYWRHGSADACDYDERDAQ